MPLFQNVLQLWKLNEFYLICISSYFCSANFLNIHFIFHIANLLHSLCPFKKRKKEKTPSGAANFVANFSLNFSVKLYEISFGQREESVYRVSIYLNEVLFLCIQSFWLTSSDNSFVHRVSSFACLFELVSRRSRNSIKGL